MLVDMSSKIKPKKYVFDFPKVVLVCYVCEAGRDRIVAPQDLAKLLSFCRCDKPSRYETVYVTSPNELNTIVYQVSDWRVVIDVVLP